MATLKDISKATGVSVTQVSRALGGYDDVKAQTRSKVLAAAKELGYRPNAMARGLKTGRTGLVALVIPPSFDSSAQETMFDMLLGISSELSLHGVKLVLHVTPTDEGIEQTYDQLYGAGGMDGFIVLYPAHNDARITYLMARGIPHVVHGRDPMQRHPFVDVDNFALAKEMTCALIERGHRRIAFLNAAEEHSFSRARSEGFADALVEAEVPTEGCTISFGPMVSSRGYQEAMELLTRADRPTAIFAGNGMLARGVYRAAAELGVRIPEDVSVIGHDDALTHYDVERFDPPLSGTRSSLGEAWAALAHVLNDVFDNGVESVEGQVLKAEFRITGSLAKV